MFRRSGQLIYKVHGSALKLIRCEICGLQYGYVMEATETGAVDVFLFSTALARETARDRAVANVAAKLRRVGAVPCPSCYSFQASMVPVVRQRYWRWMRVAGQACFVLIPFLILRAYLYYADPHTLVSPWTIAMAAVLAAAVVGGFGVSLIALRRWSAAQYDPNAENEMWRRGLAERHAILGDDLTNLLPMADNPDYTTVQIRKT